MARGESWLLRMFDKLRDSPVEYDLRDYLTMVRHVQRLEPALLDVPDSHLADRLRRLSGNGVTPALGADETGEHPRSPDHADREMPDSDLIELAALVREAARRGTGLRAYDVQVLAGLAMCRQRLVEMQTGEGKTLVALFPAVMEAVAGEGVHVLTFNDYLARRDAAWMGPAYRLLGLSVGLIQEGMPKSARRAAYRCDVVYATARQVGFDLLRDSVVLRSDEIVTLPARAAVVDEADALLVDEARVPMVLAGVNPSAPESLPYLAELAASMNPGEDYSVQDDGRNVVLTDQGLDRCEALLGCGELHSEKNLDLLIGVNCALHAHALLKRDVDYIVRDNHVQLVDECTGRVVHDRQWPYGLQTALEAKEGLAPHPEGAILASITVQSFLRGYSRLSGMTATARPAAGEVRESYGLKTVVIPPNRPCIRIDLPDYVFVDLESKTKALLQEVAAVHASGRPILLGTRTVEESERLSRRLQAAGLVHRVLNARNDEEEAGVIADAGRWGAITISTNMAGRGTDIHLGGADESDRERIAALGGLYVIGTNRHESRRIDWQLRGRAGRQGDPGASRLFVSLEDDLMVRYHGREVLPPRALIPNGEGRLENPGAVKGIGWIQRIIEGQQVTIRSQLEEYGEILEVQRQAMAELRHSWLNDANLITASPGLPSHVMPELRKALGEPRLQVLLQQTALAHLDRCWSEHLAYAGNLRESVILERLAGRSPLMEYGKTTARAFGAILDEVHHRLDADLEAMAASPVALEAHLARVSTPATTWTYLLDDDPFRNNLGLLLSGQVGLGAWAALLWPLMLTYSVVLWVKKRRTSRPDAAKTHGASEP